METAAEIDLPMTQSAPTPPSLTSDAFFSDRAAAYRILRDRHPFFHTEIDGEPCVVVTRYADVDALLRHPLITVQPEPGKFPARTGHGPAARHYRESLPSIDDPDHRRIRRIATPAFAPRAIAKMRARIEQIVERHLARLSDESEIDFIEVFASPLALEFGSMLFHMSIKDTAEILSKSEELIALLGVTSLPPGALEAADKSAAYCQAYMEDVLKTLRGRPWPEDDLVGLLLAAEGQEGGITSSEIVTTIIGFLVAAYHTTKGVSAYATAALLQHPDQKARLIADPGLARSAWEEAMRYDGAVHFLHRYASEPIMLGDQRLEPGRRILVGLWSANRDPRHFRDPDRFVIDRNEGRHHALAGGPHFCLGAQLARLEGELLMGRLFQRFPKMALKETTLVQTRDLSFPVPTRLPLSLR